jgi:hypothetical protein
VARIARRDDGRTLAVEFALDSGDCWRFHRYVYDRSPTFRLSHWLSYFFCFVVPFAGIAFPLRTVAATSPFHAVFVGVLALVGTLVLGGAHFLIGRWTTKLQVTRLPFSLGATLGRHKLTVAPEGLRCESVG